MWIIGLILTAWFAIKFGKQFRTEERVKTEFRIAPTTGNILFLPPVYRIPVKECWRGEQVILRFEVPEGKVIRPVGQAREIFPRWGCGMDE